MSHLHLIWKSFHIAHLYCLWQELSHYTLILDFVSLTFDIHISFCFIYMFLSYPPVDDRSGPWNTAMNAACVSHVKRQLYHIGHVTSIVFHCFRGRPYHLAPLMSLWRHVFSPDTHSATDWHSIFRNLYVHYLTICPLWRLWRRFTVCSLNQTFECSIHISYYFLQFEYNQLC